MRFAVDTSQRLPAPRPRLPPPPTAPAPLPAPPPLPSAAADTNQLESALPRPVPGPPLVSPPPPAGGVPAADRRRPQPASAAGLPYPPPPSSKAAGGHRTRNPEPRRARTLAELAGEDEQGRRRASATAPLPPARAMNSFPRGRRPLKEGWAAEVGKKEGLTVASGHIGFPIGRSRRATRDPVRVT